MIKIYRDQEIDEFIDSFESRRQADVQELSVSVGEILRNVQQNGDTAVAEYSRKFDNCDIDKIGFFVDPEDLQNAKQMRVTGEAEFVKDQTLHTKICEERAFLADIAGQPIDPIMEIFRVHSGQAHFWTMMDVLKEPELERLEF